MTLKRLLFFFLFTLTLGALCSKFEDHYINNEDEAKFIIIGGGPVGLFLATRLLSNLKGRVTLYESRDFTRTQCLRLAYEAARMIPEKLREQLWPKEEIRFSLFGPKLSKFTSFWPRPNYPHYPRICIGNFQTNFKTYLETTYPERFSFIKKKVEMDEILDTKDNAAVFITSGDNALSQSLRKSLNITSGFNDLNSRSEENKRGLYVTYKNENFDDYVRNGKPMNRLDLSAQGLTYSASNNEYKEVQIYVYPKNAFTDLFKSMPESTKAKLRFPKFISFDQKSDIAEENTWLNNFKKEVVAKLSMFQIKLPKSYQDVKIHYADRYEYAYEKVAAYNSNNVPIIFIGDSMGGTDFMFGLNCGRGQMLVNKVVDNLFKYKNTKIVIDEYQEEWNQILSSEFRRNNPKLTDVPYIFFKYIVLGRTVDGELLTNFQYGKFVQDYCANDAC